LWRLVYYPWITQGPTPQEIADNVGIFARQIEQQLQSTSAADTVQVLPPIDVPQQIKQVISGSVDIALMNPLGFVCARQADMDVDRLSGGQGARDEIAGNPAPSISTPISTSRKRGESNANKVRDSGGVRATAFVSDARAFIRRTSLPLLASPPQVAQTLYWYDVLDDGYQLTLGEWTMEPTPAPTWREFFTSQGIAHQTEKQACEVWCDFGIGPEDYDKPVDEDYWWDRFEWEDSPTANAYSLLSQIDVGPTLRSARGPLLEFHVGDNHPGSNQRWVNARDMLSLSLLQARLIDLKMPIKIVPGIYPRRSDFLPAESGFSRPNVT
jgi:hypothetical protein